MVLEERKGLRRHKRRLEHRPGASAWSIGLRHMARSRQSRVKTSSMASAIVKPLPCCTPFRRLLWFSIE
jgi:hypothetical protein